ncbi:MAG: putative lipoprotein [Myxococcota bacterium]|jgi:predicted lipoprotein
MVGMRYASGLTAVLCLSGCGDDSSAVPVEGKNADAHRELLTAMVDAVFLPGLREFDQHAGTLVEATAALATNPAALDDARSAWKAAMAAWQRVEVLQVGPAGMMGAVAGGQDLRDAIYSWTTVNPCRVDQEVVEQVFVDVSAFASEPVNVRGLDALEYLLFVPTAGNDCKLASEINSSGSWQALSETEIRDRRATYAHTVAQLIRTDSETLLTAWEKVGGDFAQALATGGAGSTVYPTAQAALNAVSDALFYVEAATKDIKLALPSGISGECTADCDQRVESRWAHQSKEHIVANLIAFRLSFTGGDPADASAIGFDDLLAAAGAGAVSDALVAELDAAIQAADAIPGTLAEAVIANPAAVEAAHAALKTAMTRYKTEVMGLLDLSIPEQVASDND